MNNPPDNASPVSVGKRKLRPRMDLPVHARLLLACIANGSGLLGASTAIVICQIILHIPLQINFIENAIFVLLLITGTGMIFSPVPLKIKCEIVVKMFLLLISLVTTLKMGLGMFYIFSYGHIPTMRIFVTFIIAIITLVLTLCFMIPSSKPPVS